MQLFNCFFTQEVTLDDLVSCFASNDAWSGHIGKDARGVPQFVLHYTFEDYPVYMRWYHMENLIEGLEEKKRKCIERVGKEFVSCYSVRFRSYTLSKVKGIVARVFECYDGVMYYEGFLITREKIRQLKT